MKLVRREEKVARLEAFANRHLPPESQFGGSDISLTVIAKSHDSPIVHALQAISARHPHLMPHIRMVLVQETAAVTETPAELPGLVRHARATGLGDLHEQFVVGSEAAWIGDAMRRDPERIDCYEAYLEDGSAPIGWACRAFERMWSASEPRHVERQVTITHPAFGVGETVLAEPPHERSRH